VALLVTEALYSPSVNSTHVDRNDDWVAVSADADWLDGDLEAFTKPTIFPEGGINATRVEVVLTAFCDAVFTATHGQRRDIRAIGGSSMPTSMVHAMADPELGRIVVFRVPAEESTEVRLVLPRTTERMVSALAELAELERRFQNA
jgi:hypothetical protein